MFSGKCSIDCLNFFLIGSANETRPSDLKIATAIISAPEVVVRNICPSLDVVDNIPAGDSAAPIIAPPICPTPPRKSRETFPVSYTHLTLPTKA